MILFKIAISITIGKNFKQFFFVHPILMSIFLRGKSKLYKLHYCGIHLFSLLVIKAVEISALIKIKDCDSRS